MNQKRIASRVRVAAVALCLIPAAVLAAGARPKLAEEFDPQKFLAHVKYLASDALRGRASGSPELEKAGGYIAKQFKAAGLHPFDGKSFLQAFPVTTNAKLGADNQFEYTIGGTSTKLRFQ
ncbi:MAG: hypothetical protein ABIZ80_08100, partial [Bryobacteraceae bacterium]